MSAYKINTSTGVLSAVGSYAAGETDGIAVDPTGKFLYAANNGSNNISAYAINPSSGALTTVSTYTAGTGPWVSRSTQRGSASTLQTTAALTSLRT